MFYSVSFAYFGVWKSLPLNTSYRRTWHWALKLVRDTETTMVKRLSVKVAYSQDQHRCLYRLHVLPDVLPLLCLHCCLQVNSGKITKYSCHGLEVVKIQLSHQEFLSLFRSVGNVMGILQRLFGSPPFKFDWI